MFEMIARQVSCSTQSHLPFVELLNVKLKTLTHTSEPLFMSIQCFSKATRVVSHVGRNDVVEEWQNQQSISLSVGKDVGELVQAKRGRGVVERENDDENSRTFDCLLKCRGDFVSFAKLLVVDEGVNSSVTKGSVKISGETVTSVFSSEAQENVIGEGKGE